MLLESLDKEQHKYMVTVLLIILTELYADFDQKKICCNEKVITDKLLTERS